MREIKFRIKNTNNGQWRYYDLYDQDIEDVACAENLDRTTVGQYTGLKDKNDKEVYEGDILSYFGFDGKQHTGAVEFYNGAFVLKFKIGWSAFTNTAGKNDEVIGNIYKNPELIEAKD